MNTNLFFALWVGAGAIGAFASSFGARNIVFWSPFTRLSLLRCCLFAFTGPVAVAFGIGFMITYFCSADGFWRTRPAFWREPLTEQHRKRVMGPDGGTWRFSKDRR